MDILNIIIGAWAARFTYVTAHSTALLWLHLCHRHFTYVTAHSTTFPLLYLCHSSFYNPSATSPMSQVILQAFRRFIYITGHSTSFRCFTYVTGTLCTSPGEPPVHRGMKKNSLWWLACYSKLLSLEVATVLDCC